MEIRSHRSNRIHTLKIKDQQLGQITVINSNETSIFLKNYIAFTNISCV